MVCGAGGGGGGGRPRPASARPANSHNDEREREVDGVAATTPPQDTSRKHPRTASIAAAAGRPIFFRGFPAFVFNPPTAVRCAHARFQTLNRL
jgi:hypothetical protein